MRQIKRKGALLAMADQGSLLFRSQIENLVTWFSNWSECEQTVAIYTLLRHLGPKQSRFVEHLLQEQASTDIHLDDDENHANNLNFVQSLEKSGDLNTADLSKKSNVTQLLHMLLHHFPLLHPGNDSVKAEYLRLIPRVLSHCIDMGEMIEECRKLLTYTLIHPAVSNSERNDFYKWLKELEKFKFGPKSNVSSNLLQQLYNIGGFRTMDFPRTINYAGDTMSPSARILSPAHSVNSSSSEPHRRLSRTVSAPQRPRLHAVNDASGEGGTYLSHGYPSPGSYNNQARRQMSLGTTSVPEHGVYHHNPSTHNNNNHKYHNNQHQYVRETTSSSGVRVIVSKASSNNNGGELSPRSSTGGASSTTDSDPEEGDKSSKNKDPAMSDFPAWLKSLRLQKYNNLFSKLSYNEMLNIDDKWLDERKVTTGAKNRLLQSIGKLSSRANDLQRMANEIIEGQKDLKEILTSMKWIIHSPLTPTSSSGPSFSNGPNSASGPTTGPAEPPVPIETDLSTLIVTVMGRICTQLLVNSDIHEECYSVYIQLVEKCTHVDVFNSKQRSKFQDWKAQVIRYKKERKATDCRPDMNHRRFYSHRSASRHNSWNPQQRAPIRRAEPPSAFHQRMDYLACPWDNAYDKKPLQLTYSGPPSPFQNSIASTDETLDPIKRPVHRTQSAPIKQPSPLSHTPLSLYPHGSAGTPPVHMTAHSQATEPEINECLDSLARSMTEHALSSQDSVENDDSTN